MREGGEERKRGKVCVCVCVCVLAEEVNVNVCIRRGATNRWQEWTVTEDLIRLTSLCPDDFQNVRLGLIPDGHIGMCAVGNPCALVVHLLFDLR